MTTHDVKLDPYYAKAVLMREKQFEIYDDRDYQVGDTLNQHTSLDGVNIVIEAKIIYKLVPSDPWADGLQIGYCALGLKRTTVRVDQ